MKFPYTVNIVPAIDSGEEIVLLRPEIPIRIYGPSGGVQALALVDSGADNSIFPMSIAKLIGIATKPGMAGATAFGGQQIALSYADVQLEIIDSEEDSLRWLGRIYFTDFPEGEERTVVVGHEGFLDYFTAIFDGKECVLDLQPNDELPRIDS